MTAQTTRFDQLFQEAVNGLIDFHPPLRFPSAINAIKSACFMAYQDTGNAQQDYEIVRNAVETAVKERDSMQISAEVHSDDRVHEVEFNASEWFYNASAEAVHQLAECGWGGDYAADAVALFYEDRDTDVTQLFKYVHSIQDLPSKKDACGFECSVDEDEAIAWLMHHRQALALELVDAEDCDVAVWVGTHYKRNLDTMREDEKQVWRDRYKVAMFGNGAEYNWKIKHYDVTVTAIGSDSSEGILGTVRVAGAFEREAEEKALEALWDARLNADSCRAVFDTVEVEDIEETEDESEQNAPSPGA